MGLGCIRGMENLNIESPVPVNALTGNPYKGSNVETLLVAMIEGGYSDPRFLTFRQALELGRVVRKGQKAAARVVKFKRATPEEKEKYGRDFIACGGWNVFNYEQTDKLEQTEKVAA